MVNYKDGKIYKIISDETNEIYIGSTAEKYLSKRLQKHKSNYRDFININNKSRKFTRSYLILFYEDARIVLIERYPCDSREELLAREQYWIDEYKDICVNRNRSFGQNPKEYWKKYYYSNHEKNLERNRKYKENNREKESERKRIYRQKIKLREDYYKTCECGGSFTPNHKARHERTKKHQLYIA